MKMEIHPTFLSMCSCSRAGICRSGGQRIAKTMTIMSIIVTIYFIAYCKSHFGKELKVVVYLVIHFDGLMPQNIVSKRINICNVVVVTTPTSLVLVRVFSNVFILSDNTVNGGGGACSGDTCTAAKPSAMHSIRHQLTLLDGLPINTFLVYY